MDPEDGEDGLVCERISDSDRQMVARMQTEVTAAQRLQTFVSEHLAAVYGLAPGDKIEDDGRVVRMVPPEPTSE